MRSAIIAGVATVGVAMVAAYSLSWRAYQTEPGVVAPVVAFVAQISEESFKPPENPVPFFSIRHVYAVRANGENVSTNEGVSPDGAPVRVSGIHLSDRYVVVDPLTESVTSYLPSRSQPHLVRSATNCGGTPDGMILGYAVNLVTRRLVTHNKVSTLSMKSWLARDLNCFALREYRERTDGPPFESRSRTVVSVTSVVVGEPPVGLFEVPDAYTERSPVDVQHEFNRRFPGRELPDVPLGVQRVYEYRKPK